MLWSWQRRTPSPHNHWLGTRSSPKVLSFRTLRGIPYTYFYPLLHRPTSSKPITFSSSLPQPLPQSPHWTTPTLALLVESPSFFFFPHTHQGHSYGRVLGVGGGRLSFYSFKRGFYFYFYPRSKSNLASILPLHQVPEGKYAYPLFTTMDLYN